MIGHRIEHYKITEVLGEGGMGIVYKAFDLKLERYAAIKILNSTALNNPQFVERFKREAKNQAKLTHPNIVPVYGFTEGMKVLGIVMEYVEGETLEKLIMRQGRLTTAQAINLMVQILSGSAYAHNKGFIHRDLKPSNIIISKEGTAKIMDFGISKSLTETKGITRTGVKIGTVLYMSPEQIKANEPTIQSDIYSLGLIFYEMLTGHNPFDFPTEFEILEAHLKKNPPKISAEINEIPSEIDAIIARATNKSISKRYSTCEEFASELEIISAKMTLEHNKRTTKKTAARKVKLPLLSKLKFGLFAVFITLIFSAFFYFIYLIVADYTSKTKDNKPNLESGENSYQANPSFTTASGWKGIFTGTTSNLYSIDFADRYTGIAAGSGVILGSENGGENWVVLADSGFGSINKIAALSADNFIAAGDSGTILISTNKGVEWNKINVPVNSSFFGFTFLPNNRTGFCVGDNGTILKTIDAGITWKKIGAPVSELLYTVAFFSEKEGIIAGWNGVVLKTENVGETWTKVNRFTDKYIKDIAVIDDQTAVVCCGGGEVYKTADRGETWKKAKSPTISGLYAVIFTDNQTGFIFGSRGEVLISKDSGESWEKTSSGTFGTLNSAAKKPGGYIYAAGNNGIMIFSTATLN